MKKNSKYHMCNDEVLSLIEEWKGSSLQYKDKILSDLVYKLSYMVKSKIRYYRSQFFYDDLLQEGKIGVMRAIEDFNPSRGTNFFSFVSWHIQTKINSCLRLWKCSKNNVDIDKFADNVFQYTPHDYLEKIYDKKFLIKAVNFLPEIDRKVIMMHYGICGHKNHTFKQIGNIFSLSRQRIQQIETRAISKLGKYQEIKECE